MKRIVVFLLCGVLMLSSLGVFANNIDIVEAESIAPRISLAKLETKDKPYFETDEGYFIDYIIGYLNSLKPTKDDANLSQFKCGAKVLTVDGVEFVFYENGYMIVSDRQFKLNDEDYEQFLRLEQILIGNEELPEEIIEDSKIYVNDELLPYPVYYNRYTENQYKTAKDFVPLVETLKAMGVKMEFEGSDVVIVKSGRSSRLTIRENYIHQKYFYGDVYSGEPYDTSSNSNNIFPCRNINGVIYCPISKVVELSGNGQYYREGNNVYLDGYEYYNSNHVLGGNIGRKINDIAYINEIPIDSPVYINTDFYIDHDIIYNYVELRPAFESMGADVSYEAPNIINIHHKDFEYTFEADIVVWDGKQAEYTPHYSDGCIIVEGKTYIPFIMIRVACDGTVKPEEGMVIYTEDYIVQKIPKTLGEAYKYLNENLKSEDIEFIKNATDEEMLSMHFGLGLWIRNNWIYPSTEAIAKVFLDKSINMPDTMSGYILDGYKMYLNGEPCEIDDIIKKNEEYTREE